MNSLNLRFALGLAVLATASSAASAALKLGSPFGDHMVLQQGRPVPIWGTASPGETVTIACAGQVVSAQAGADGRWLARLAPLSLGAPQELSASSGTERITLEDILVGEVWLASGQSNMEFSVSKKVKYFAGATNEEQEIAAAKYPQIRMFTGDMVKSNEPQAAIGGAWKVCSPETVPAFSAIGYFFARDLQRVLNVPIGIINESYGASTAEAWVQRETLAADPDLQPMLGRYDAAYSKFKSDPDAAARYAAARKAYQAAAAEARAAGKRAGRPPRDPDPSQDQHSPTVLFNAMIEPVLPYALRGAIWYQGESIVGGAPGVALYPKVQAALVRNWRQRWGEGDFPFYIVQLAAQDASSNSPEVRAAQAMILSLPNTGMAVTVDIGEKKNVHPHDKQDVGDRLSRIALAQAYGRDVEWSGPAYAGLAAEGDALRVSFARQGGGLVAHGGELQSFEIAGADGKFVPAEARIEGETVVVRSPAAPAPRAVRYAWADYPQGCNLYNTSDLPAAPFSAALPAPGNNGN
ncbi:MAG TPA: sialate O-acetylesterase [Opitutaceae bacterium]|jgi:sialate O-acetylesterase|nr:sialate O-acetylesterase [Opitutaceae bacterium]